MVAHFEIGPVRELVHELKYGGITELAGLMGAAAAQAVMINGLTDFVLVPVPLHRDRLAQRGFNQAELLGYEVAQKFKIAMWPDLLRRRKNTKPQIELKREKRLVNMTGAFQLNKQYGDKIKNANILLVDDVITTGATMNECAKILKNSGAGAVWGLALARG